MFKGEPCPMNRTGILSLFSGLFSIRDLADRVGDSYFSFFISQDEFRMRSRHLMLIILSATQIDWSLRAPW
jgi:hypothetical protein